MRPNIAIPAPMMRAMSGTPLSAKNWLDEAIIDAIANDMVPPKTIMPPNSIRPMPPEPESTLLLP
jgi:hypothetical protein